MKQSYDRSFIWELSEERKQFIIGLHVQPHTGEYEQLRQYPWTNTTKLETIVYWLHSDSVAVVKTARWHVDDYYYNKCWLFHVFFLPLLNSIFPIKCVKFDLRNIKAEIKDRPIYYLMK